VINDNAAFGQVGEFTAVDPGDINIAVKQGGNVDVNRTITVEERKCTLSCCRVYPVRPANPGKHRSSTLPMAHSPMKMEISKVE